MITSLGPVNIYPYQIDFGAAYLCSKLKIDSEETYFDICDVLLRVYLNAISPMEFDYACQKIHPQFRQLFLTFNHFIPNKQCAYYLRNNIHY